MGILSIFLYAVPISIAATAISFNLGPRLPIACRKMGQRIGLGYQVFKAVLKINMPKDIMKSNEVLKLYRQSEQQANALNREFKSQMYKIKQEIKETVPEELRKNPFQVQQLRNEVKNSVNIQNNATGAQLISLYQEEMLRLRQIKKDKIQRNSFYS